MASGQEEYVVQDGVQCPRQAPWGPKVSKVTGLPFLLITVLAVIVLANTSVALLIVWLILLGIFFWPLRYLICARCPYYGQECSSNMGKLVTKMFDKQEGKSMRLGLWLDVVMFFLLFFTPIFQVWQFGGYYMLAAWAAAFFLVFAVMTKAACSACPFTFCPIGKAGRACWGAKHPAGG